MQMRAAGLEYVIALVVVYLQIAEVKTLSSQVLANDTEA